MRKCKQLTNRGGATVLYYKKQKVMKKIILLALATMLTLNVVSQTPLTGIGQLKLYSPISLINDLGYTSNTKIIDNQADYFKYVYEQYSGDNIYEIVMDSTKQSEQSDYYDGYYNKDVRKFYLPVYEVIPTLKIEGLSLVFYKDTLVSIQCSSSNELSDALNSKYGEPALDVKRVDHTFTYTYTGANVTKTDETYTQTWKTNAKDVSCHSVLLVWYNDKAKKRTVYNFYLSDTHYEKIISDIESKIREGISERAKLSKKKKYDGI